MLNSINFIDGLDGLSSGVVFIAAVTLGLISLTLVSQVYVAVLCFALAGALLGFVRYNLHPATIIVGTSGVMFMGYTLAVLSIVGTAKIAVALRVLAVPIIDAFWIHRPAGRAAPVAVLAGPWPPPPPPARRRPVAPPDGPADLRDLHRPGRTVAAAVGRRPGLRVPRRVRADRAGPARALADRSRRPGRAGRPEAGRESRRRALAGAELPDVPTGLSRRPPCRSRS